MAAAELRHECTALDQLVQELFADLERLRTELELKADEVEDSRRRLADRGRQLAEQRKETSRLSQQIDQQDGQLREAITELRGLREQLDHERQEASEREEKRAAALQQRLAQVETERDELRRRAEALQAQAAAGGGGSGGADLVTPLLTELAELRRHVLETRTELSGAIDRAAASRSDAGVTISGEGGERLLAAEKERAELEAELELVRTRAAELQETVAQQKRELATQRDEMQSELKLLRQLIEQQAELAAAGEPRRETGNLTVARTGPAMGLVRPPAKAEEPAAAADPVVSSVMAQFARLQKDVAQRRQKVKK